MDENLRKLYEAVSGKFNIGTYEDFSVKMQTPESRKSFYDAVASKGFSLGDYNEYESRLKKKVATQEPTSTNQELDSTSTTGEQPTGSVTGEIELNLEKPKGWDIQETLLDLERQKIYSTLQNSTSEQRASMGFESLPETYAQFSKENPTAKEKIKKVEDSGLNVFEEKIAKDQIIQEESNKATKAKQDTYDRNSDYSEQKIAIGINKAIKEGTKLTPEGKREIQDEYNRLKRGDLNFWESVQAYALGLWDTGKSSIGFMPNTHTFIPPSFKARMPEADEQQIKREYIKSKKLDHMKSLSEEDLQAYQNFLKYSPEGANAQAEVINRDVEVVLKESDFLQERIVNRRSHPLIDGYMKAYNQSQQEADNYLESLDDSEKKEFYKQHQGMVDLIEIQQDNLNLLNSIEDDIMSYDVESELAEKNFSVGTNLGIAYVNSFSRIGSGVLDAATDPLIALSKPDDMSYQEFRDKYMSDTWSAKLKDVVEESEPHFLGQDVNNNWWSLPRLGLIAAEQVPVLATIAAGGQGGLGILSASVYGNKIDEYAKIDGEIDYKDRFAAGTSAGAEYLSERVTLGIMNKAGRSFKAATVDGKISDVFSKQFGLGLAKNAVSEGNSEVLATFGENFADIYIAGLDNKHIFSGFEESWRTGAIMGGIMRGAPEVAGSTIGQYFGTTSQLNKIKKTNIEMQKLMGEGMSPDLTDGAYEIISDRVEKLSDANQKRVENYISRVENMSDADVQELMKLGNLTDKARKDLDIIQNSGAMSVEIKADLASVKEQEIKDLETKKDEILENQGTGEGTQKFFGDVVSGKSEKYIPSKPYEYESEFTESQDKFRKNYDTKKGNFDEHIATSIPTFRDTQVKKGNAIVESYGDQEGGALVYDLGGSEGGFAQTITEESEGNIKTINLDPSPEMKKAFDKTKPEGSEMVLEAFGKGWEGVPTHKPKQKADVVHESMMFQFIEDGGERSSKIKEVKDNYLKEGGVLITEQKFKGDPKYDQNEKIKNTQHKNKYFTKEQIESKGEEVLVGMSENQADINKYESELRDNFKYVGRYWKAGNFSGFIATNNKNKFDELMSSIGDTSNRYNSVDSVSDIHNKQGGSSVTQEGQVIDKGYSVSPYTDRSVTIKGKNITEEQIDKFKEDNKDLLDSNPNAFIGTWYDSKSDNTYLDVSINESNKDKAIEIAKENNQKAIWDFENNTEIDTGGTGEVQVESKVKETFHSAAESLRSLKTNQSIKDSMSKLSSSPLPIFEAAWNSSVEIAATTLEATGNLVEAIEKGVANLKKSDWYNNLSDRGKHIAEKNFKDSMRMAYKDTKTVENKGVKERISDAVTSVRNKLGQVFSDKLFNFKLETRDLKGYEGFLNQDSVWQSKAAGRSRLIKDRMMDIIKKAKKKGISVQELSDWMMAKHAAERNKYIEENVDEDNPFGSGLNPVQIDNILNKPDADRKKALDELANEVYAIVEGTRKRMLESGLISQEVYDTLSEVENYVPLTNFEDESIEVAMVRQGKSLSIKGKEFKKAGGRTTKAGNVLVNILQQATAVEVRSAKNEFLQTIHDLIENNPDADLGKVYTDKTKPTARTVSEPTYVPMKVDGQQKYMKFYNDVFAKNVQDTTDYQVGTLLQNLSKLNNYFRAVITTYNPEFMLGNFPRDLETAVIHLQAQQDINPDIKGKKITTETVKNLGTAIKAIAKFELGKHKVDSKWTRHYENFIKDGGKTGWTEQTSYEDTLRELEKMYDSGAKALAKSKIRKFADYIESVNSAVENGVRFSAYVAAVEAGASREAAASLAKELTVNFNRKGEAGTLLNAMYLFSNTAIQGTMTMYRNLARRKNFVDENGKQKKGLTNAQKLAGALVAVGGLIPLLNRAISDEDEESGELHYDMIPDFVKERNIVIMTSGDNYITIPLPYGYNVFYNFGETTSDVITGNRDVTNASQFLWGAVLGSFSPVPVAKRDTALETIGASAIPTEPLRFTTDILSNKNYNNMNIFNVAPPYVKGEVPDSQLGRKNTPDWAKWTAGLLNEVTGGSEFRKGLIDINPDTMIYAIHKAGGGVSKLVERSFSLGQKAEFNLLGKKATEEGERIKEEYGVSDKKDIDLHTIPFVRRYFGESQDVYFTSKYYDIREEVYTDYNELKGDIAANDGNYTKAQEKEAIKVEKVKSAIDIADNKLKELRGMEKALPKMYDNRRDLQAAVNAIDKQKTSIYKQLYKIHKDAYKKK